jgi:hypothetical protein
MRDMIDFIECRCGWEWNEDRRRRRRRARRHASLAHACREVTCVILRICLILLFCLLAIMIAEVVL